MIINVFHFFKLIEARKNIFSIRKYIWIIGKGHFYCFVWTSKKYIEWLDSRQTSPTIMYKVTLSELWAATVSEFRLAVCFWNGNIFQSKRKQRPTMRVFIFQSYLAATVMAKTLVSIENDLANVRHDSRELEMYRRTLRTAAYIWLFSDNLWTTTQSAYLMAEWEAVKLYSAKRSPL